MAADGLAARSAAVAILDAVLGERRMMADILSDPAGPLVSLAPGDRGRAQRLATDVLRHLEQADKVLSPHLRRVPPRSVQNTLRLAVVELAVGGAAAHGVVNSAVDLVRRGRRTGHFAGLVNAVLRKLAATPELFAGLPPQRMPMWLRQPLVRTWGRDCVQAIEAVQATTPPLDLTPRTADVSVPGAVRLPNGSWRLQDFGQITAMPGYAEGDWWVQDAASAMAVPVLAPKPGERVLDLCAAPGGKTLQLAAAGAEVTSVDISGPRLERLRENLRRTGLTATVVAADVLQWQPALADFDAVLLDAPCSATGTIRRHPDLPFVRDGSDLEQLAALQSAMIDRALGFLRPGGRLVYCTCSLFPDEGETQIAQALARHPGLAAEPADLAGIPPDWITEGGGLRLRPDYWAAAGGMDGFFIARLRKPDHR